jgi:hypothetical protein
MRKVIVDVFDAKGLRLFAYPMHGNLPDADFARMGVSQANDDKLKGVQPFSASVREDLSAGCTNTYSSG